MEFLENIKDLTDNLSSLIEFMSEISSFLKGAAFFFGILILAFGILQCFFGFRIARILETISGFFIFGVLGTLLGLLGENHEPSILFGIIFGILGAFLSYKLFKFGIFILCAMFGFLMGFFMGGLKGIILGDVTTNLVIGIVCAVITGVLGLFFTKAFIIISTSFSGGWAIGLGLALIGLGFPGFVIGIICIIVGCIVQFTRYKDVPMSAASPNQFEKKKQDYPNQQCSNNVVMPIINSNQTVGQHTNQIETYCSNCGEKYIKDVSFCSKCGAAIAKPVANPIVLTAEQQEEIRIQEKFRIEQEKIEQEKKRVQQEKIKDEERARLLVIDRQNAIIRQQKQEIHDKKIAESKALATAEIIKIKAFLKCHKKVVIIVCAFCITAIVTIGVIHKQIEMSENYTIAKEYYSSAEDLYKQGEFENAGNQFSTATDCFKQHSKYKNSDKLLIDCQFMNDYCDIKVKIGALNKICLSSASGDILMAYKSNLQQIESALVAISENTTSNSRGDEISFAKEESLIYKVKLSDVFPYVLKENISNGDASFTVNTTQEMKNYFSVDEIKSQIKAFLYYFDFGIGQLGTNIDVDDITKSIREHNFIKSLVEADLLEDDNDIYRQILFNSIARIGIDMNNNNKYEEAYNYLKLCVDNQSLFIDKTIFNNAKTAYGQCSVSIGQKLIDEKNIGQAKKLLEQVDSEEAKKLLEQKTWGNIKQIVCTHKKIIGLKDNGTFITKFSEHYYNDSEIRENSREYEALSNVIKVINDDNGAEVFLKSDGTVLTEKTDWHSDAEAVKKWSNIIDIDMSEGIIVGLKSDGTIVQSGIDTESKYEKFTGSLNEFTNIKKVYAVWGGILGIRNDGTVACFFESNSKSAERLYKQVKSWSKVLKIIGYKDLIYGKDFDVVLGLRTDGKTYFYEKDESELENFNINQWTNIKKIILSGGNVIGLKNDGTVISNNKIYNNKEEILGMSKPVNDICINGDSTDEQFIVLFNDGTVENYEVNRGYGNDVPGELNEFTDIVKIFPTPSSVYMGQNSKGEIIFYSRYDDVFPSLY